MKNQRAFEIPPILTPQGRRCVLIEIPDERIHIANFWGSLTSLTQWRSWKRDEDKSGRVLATLWKEIIYSAWDRFERGECCPEPEPCPEPQPQPQTGGGSGSGVGSMGYTIEELEEMLLMAVTKIEYRNGELWYRDGCCDWYQVTEQSGAQFIASSAINKPEGQTLQSWANAGKPNLSVGQTPVGTDNPFYTTSDSMACAKATAITEFFQTLLSEVKDGVGTSALSITGLFQALATVSELLGFQDTALIMEFATVVVGSITGGTALDFSNDVDTALADTHWNDVICASVSKMTPVVTVGPFTGNLVTEADVNAVYQEALSKIEMSDKVAQVLQTFPLSAIQNKVRQLLPSQECGCESYLPFGYHPPLTGMTQFFEMVYAGAPGSNAWSASGQSNFAGIDQTPVGTKLLQNSYESEYIGETYEGQPIYYHGFAVVFEKAVGVVIDTIKADIVLSGTFSECKQQLDAFIPGTGWTNIQNGNNYSANQSDYSVFSGGNLVASAATHFRIQARGRGTTGSSQLITWSDMKITGTRDGDGFTNAALGT